MREERPIVFTITKITDNFGRLYRIYTKDSRYKYNQLDISVLRLFETMIEIADDVNDKGYAVLFEVDWYVDNA